MNQALTSVLRLWDGSFKVLGFEENTHHKNVNLNKIQSKIQSQ